MTEKKKRKPYKKRDKSFIEIEKPIKEKKQDKESTTVEEVDPSQWRVGALAQKAVNSIKRARIYRGSIRDTVMSLMVNEEDKILFTDGVYNRLTAMIRGLYNEVILIDIETEQEIEQRRQHLLLVKAKRAAYRKEQEYKKSQSLTV